jgi:hypothetical protein
MKHANQTRHNDGLTDLRAKMAIQRIQKFIEKRYPVMAPGHKTRLIIECLIELTEERNLIAQGRSC